MIRTMKLLAVGGALSILLGGCGANSQAQLDAFKAVLQDTNCSHDDKLAIVTGAAGIAASVTVSAERHCPVGGASKTPVGTTPP